MHVNTSHKPHSGQECGECAYYFRSALTSRCCVNCMCVRVSVCEMFLYLFCLLHYLFIILHYHQGEFALLKVQTCDLGPVQTTGLL